MPFKTDDVGLLLEIVSKSDGSSTKEQLVLQASADNDLAFCYGIFPTKLMVLLIAAKNKFKGLKKIGKTDVPDIKEVNLLGLALPTGKKPSDDNLLTYSTLPFVYICNNDLGRGGITVPIYEFPASGKSLTGKQVVSLNRDCGNFFLQPASPYLDTTGFETDTITSKDFLELMVQYNSDFINSGVESGNLLKQLWDRHWTFAPSYPFKNVVFADVLDEVANRWFKSSGSTKDYNIGASLYLCASAGQTGEYKPLMSSLNIKSVNKAAHAEVRIALLLDFLTQYGATRGATVIGTPLADWSLDINSASAALQSILSSGSGTNQLALFSSLLPCYMCLGNVETTVGGYIKSINGQPVNLNATFQDVSQTALIVDTNYYDVDSAVEYRSIDIFKKSSGGDTSDQLLASINPINVSEPLVSNVRLTLATDSSITPLPMSVSDAGSATIGIGLQNQPSMLRYNLAAASLRLVHSTTAKSVIDDARSGAASGAGGDVHATETRSAAVHSYSAQ